MSENKKYVVKIKGDLVEVTPEQYYAYYGEDRRERAQKEKKIRNKVMSYDALDTTDRVGLDTMRDTTTPSMDELAIQEELRSLLYQAIDLLPRKERELVYAIYFDEVDKGLYAEQIGMTIWGLN